MPSDPHCPSCGHENPVGANFCSSCGRQLVDANDAPTGAIEVIDLSVAPAGTAEEREHDEFDEDRARFPAGVGLFIVQRGPKAGSRYALDQPVTSAGRHPESDIFLDDITVSRRHAEVTSDDDGYVVRDVGSLNGTYLNRDLIGDQPARMHDGDVLQVGKFKLLFLLGTS